MRCHYEVLNIARDADDTEIKAAYRKLALKWHPDKNPDNPEYSKEQFQLVQQAYEVLSDRQERAWYDSHREQILKGSRDNTNYTDNSLDVFQYFTTSCFKGYGDDENGFYAVYRKVFEQIAAEDIEYMESKSELGEIPSFGDSQSDYDTVVGPFYAYWMSYSTKKSYVWLDPYDIREARDRRVLKLIEKENKKVRAKAKKERNEEVRNLVAFVRKRDKRVQAHSKLLAERNLENRKKQEELRKQMRLKRTEELNKAKENEQEWSKFENMSSELKEIEKQLAEEFGEELTDEDNESTDTESITSQTRETSDDKMENFNLYCIACNKLFKTTNSYDNHQSSKKHRDNVELLKNQLIAEENGHTILDESIITNEKEPDATTPLERNQENETKKKKNKKKKQIQNIHLDDTSEVEELDFDIGLSKKQKKKNLREQQMLAAKNRLEQSSCENASLATRNGDAQIQSCACDNQLINNEDVIKKEKKTNLQQRCAVCKTDFPSKNKLFDHLKKTGHSVAISGDITTASGTQKKSDIKQTKNKKNRH